MRKNRFAIVLCTAALWGGPGIAQAQTTFYVSPSGNDTNAGSQAAPFATIERARDAIRAFKGDRERNGPVTVLVRGGTYFLEEPLVFTPQDSGTERSPVIYAAYPGETPVLSGGFKISGWKSEGRLWTAQVPGVKDGTTPVFTQLWVNGRRCVRARTPNDGYFRVDKPGETKGRVHTLDKPAMSFVYAPGDLRADWTNLRDAAVVVLNYWLSNHLPVAGVDEATRTVSFQRGSLIKLTEGSAGQGARYFIENVPEALDRPGEWYLNRQTGVLSYMPRHGEDPARAEAIAPRLEALVRFEGNPQENRHVENVTLRGLTLSHNDWRQVLSLRALRQGAFEAPGAVILRGARDCALETCRLEHFGSYGVEIGEGCARVRVLRCEISDGAAGGVKIDGGDAQSPPALRTGHNRVEDCHIHGLGRIYPAGMGVLLADANANVVAHNHIHDLFQVGISAGWVWGYSPSVSRNNIIEFNHVHDIGQGVLSDIGGIYTLGVSPGTVIRNNLIHGVQSYGYGGRGIYTDQASSGILIENNVVYDVKHDAFFQHWGKGNVVRNNILVSGGRNVVYQQKADPPQGQFRLERNILLSNGVPLYGGGGFIVRQPSFTSDSNLLWDTSGRLTAAAPPQKGDAEDAVAKANALSLERWRALGQDRNSLVADPGFVDPQKGDFRLRPGSPALKIGFRPLDLSTVGVRRDPGKTSDAPRKQKAKGKS